MCCCDKMEKRIRLYQECVWESIQEVLGDKILKDNLTRDELFSYMELVAMKKFEIESCHTINFESKNS